MTDLGVLLKCACDFWGLNDTSYHLYNDLPEQVFPEEHEHHGGGVDQVTTVEKYFESASGSKSQKDSAKVAVLYLAKDVYNLNRAF